MIYLRILRLLIPAIMLSAACGSHGASSGGGDSVPHQPTCLPAPLHLSSYQPRAGSQVTVSSAALPCGGSYQSGKTYRIILGLAGRSAPVDLGTFPVERNGAFHAVVRIPRTAPTGEAYFIIKGSAFDECQDASSGPAPGHGNSCAAYSVAFRLLPPG